MTTEYADVTTETLCVPRDDCDGHNTCTSENEMICLDGYLGESCNVKDISSSEDDPDCLFGLSAVATCFDRGYCFQGACCCDDDAFDDDNMCLDIDECESDPCMNGGTCFNQVSGYICVCTEGKCLN